VNSFVMNLVSLPKYVNLAHFILDMGVILFWGLGNVCCIVHIVMKYLVYNIVVFPFVCDF
jgi:hypothetical protein